MRQIFSTCYSNEDGLFKIAFTLLLLAPLSLMLGIAPFDTIISLLGFLFLIHSFLEKDFSWLKDSWVKIFVLLWLYMIIRGFFALEPITSVMQSLIFARFALLTLALQDWLLRKTSNREAFVISIIITLLFAVADGLIQLLSSNDFLGHRIPVVDFQIPWRLTAISGKQNIGAKIMMLAIPAIAYLINLYQTSTNKLLTYLAFIMTLSLIVFVPLTGERNATIMVLLGLVLMFFMHRPYRKTLLTLSPFIGIFFILFAQFSSGFKERYVTSLIGVTNHFASIEGAPTSAIPYAALFTTDKNIFLNNPLFGVGRKQYHIYCEKMSGKIAVTKKYIEECVTNAQNIYFEWLDETGLIGALLFFSIPLLWFRQFYAKRTFFLTNAVALGALIEIVLRLWPIASTSSFFFSWCGGPFWLMAGWVMAYLNENRSLSI